MCPEPLAWPHHHVMLLDKLLAYLSDQKLYEKGSIVFSNRQLGGVLRTPRISYLVKSRISTWFVQIEIWEALNWWKLVMRHLELLEGRCEG